MKKRKLYELYERTLKNCLFYEKEGKQLHLLNEIGVLRGIVYCLKECCSEYIDGDEFLRLIALQKKLTAKDEV